LNTNKTDGATVVTMYFEDRIAAAQKEVEAAQAALAAAEAKVTHRQVERDTFAEHGTLPQGPADKHLLASLQPEWEVCRWAQNRIGEVAFKDMSPAGDAVYRQRKAEASAAHAWLEQHGYTVPDVFQEQL
jgi:hypothetical protein